MNPRTLSRAHGTFNVLSGAWALLHLRSFEAVLGPKVDRWLVRTVAGLLVVNGTVQLTAGPAPGEIRQAARLGVGTALTMALIDVVYAGRGRISKVYLVDAVIEAAWIAGWVSASRPHDCE
ncbi:hypothetical protein [Nakamurella sp.]|uniref:hypothetical protein n=1 Tax=Nakamurella sp. TaxID=1869182 RepID=UPI003B3BBFDE